MHRKAMSFDIYAQSPCVPRHGAAHTGTYYILYRIIPTRSRQAYSKQVRLWDLAQIICITFIIQVAWAI